MESNFTPTYLQIKSVPLTKSQFAPYDLYDNLTLETFVRGLATQKSQVTTWVRHSVLLLTS